MTADPSRPAPQLVSARENIIMVGSTRLSALYIKFLEAYTSGQHRVIAVLDDELETSGRAVAGVRIVGRPQHLDPVIEEYSEHGINVDRVIVGGDATMLPQGVIKDIERTCMQRGLRLDYVPALIGLDDLQTDEDEAVSEIKLEPQHEIILPAYFKVKHLIDFCITLVLLLLLLPMFAMVACITLIDVGSPILFWQQRIGVNGRTFLVHKFRTLKPSYNQYGVAVPGTDRMSWVGNLVRLTRLDELPQLLNVLVGDMSLCGPRPLLPHDQPPNPTLRLMVRPGLTGWAQVNGGNLLSAEEKNELDEWYVRNASFLLDMRIFLKTLHMVALGERRRSAEPVRVDDTGSVVPLVSAQHAEPSRHSRSRTAVG